MGEAKNIVLRPIPVQKANELVKRLHYSGKATRIPQVNIGVFYRGELEGAMQFGPPMDRRKLVQLVEDTKWNEFLELNRMAFSETLPRNSESRALSIAMRVLRSHAPHIKWIVSFADATQCGDGGIYRASGFVLTQIRRSTAFWTLPDGYTFSRKTVTSLGGTGGELIRQEIYRRTGVYVGHNGASSMKALSAVGAKTIPGYQLRYIYFLDPTARERLTVPVIPFDAIPDDVRMYRGQKLCAGSVVGDASATHVEEGGSIPTPAL